jgi:DNA-binding HxlR family transcriptional regulator
MAEPAWKVVMNEDGVTISGDQFVLTTNGSEPGQLDTVISELQGVVRGTYGQYCGLSRATEMVGERWGLLIIRDLLVSSRSEAELLQGLPLINARSLAMRLKEMAYNGVIRKVEAQDAEVRYELTEYGRAIEDVVLALGRWGAMALAAPRPEDVMTEDSVMTTLMATFQADATRDIQMCFEMHVSGVVVHGVVDHGKLEMYRGQTSDADIVIHPGTVLKSLLTGEITAADALAGGSVVISGPAEMLSWFVASFHLPQLPSPVGV